MPDLTPRTQADLALLDHLQQPVWVFDLDAGVKWWANRRALVLWNVASNAEMRARSPVRDMSEATRIRLDALRRRLAHGEVARERWNFYPTGAATFLADITLSGIVIAESAAAPPRLAMLVEARPLQPDDVDPFVRRGVEVLRYLGEMVSLYTATGELLMRNPAAVAAFGDVADLPPGSDALAATFVDPASAATVRAAIATGPFRGEVQARSHHGDAWHAVEARPSLDPVTGDRCLLVNQCDITDRIAERQLLQENQRQLAAQAEALRRLAVVPLIGELDGPRMSAALISIGHHLASERIVRVLLDVTGCEHLDADAAAGLRRITAVLGLQGIATGIVGIHPKLAATLVAAAIDLGRVPVYASLAEALAASLPQK